MMRQGKCLGCIKLCSNYEIFHMEHAAELLKKEAGNTDLLTLPVA